MHLRIATTTLAAVIALLAAPAGAAAATTCELASGVLDVTMSAGNDTTEMSVASGQILVFGAGGPVTCAGAAPTVTNTNAISVHNAPGLFDTDVTIHQPNTFAPGLIAEAGDDEIEIFVNLNDSEASELRINPPVAGGTIFLGTGGINPNATSGEDQPDADIVPNMAPMVVVNGNSGPDFISAQGGRGTGGPVTDNISLHGGGGSDNLQGGGGNDIITGTGSDLNGNGGNDLLIGGSSPSILSGGEGDDVHVGSAPGDLMLGGDGTDTVDYSFFTAGVTVDLADMHDGIENLVGSNFNDILRGDDGPNLLNGLQGDDVLEGRGGNDDLRGREGGDTLAARDGGPDAANCGLDTDTVITDVSGVDTLTECENVLFPGLDPGPGGGGPGGGGDVTPARMTAYRLSGSTFVAASKGPSVAAARGRGQAKVGTRVRYTLSEPATVRFAVERAMSGRRVRGQCRKPSPGNQRQKRCTRYRTLKGTFTHTGRQGPNSFKFTGRLRGRKLSPGRYRLVARATDAAGNRSKQKRLEFRVVTR
jgi:Ca2+-binding RTX toxin-like protein